MLILITVLALFGTALWVAAPLMRRQAYSPAPPRDERLNDLLEAKHSVYRSILDLEFDRKMDKVSEEDYRIMRTQYEAEALKILAETDAAWTTDVLEIEIAAARDRLRN